MEPLNPATDGASANIVGENLAKLRELFPDAFTENSEDGEPRWKVDFDALREVLGDAIEGKSERYSFTWNGKGRAKLIANTPTTATLRPCPEESVNWDTTKNLFIEGDNLEVLKLLQKSYHRKVKMIYIDPPYNTGNEFIYPDKFQDNLDTYLRYSGQVDDEGFKLSANAETGGRFHTNWLNMMYPRLRLARSLLKDDGILFVSIDDHEVSNLRSLCDEVFGEENFIATVIWQKVYAPKNSARHFSEDHDYVLVYARNAEVWRPYLLPRTAEQDALYTNPDDDPRGPWMSDNLTARNHYAEGSYQITGKTGKSFGPGRGRYWRSSFAKFQDLDADSRIWWGADGGNMPRLKRFLSEVSDGRVPQTLWTYKEVGHTQDAKRELLKYVSFENTENVLNSVKPTRLIQQMLRIATTPGQNDVVLDFFAGSGPTGHAVMAQNAEDNGDRRFVLVQLPEPLPTPEPSLSTIADLARSRLTNVQSELTKADSETLDGQGLNSAIVDSFGFRTFRLTDSCLVPWDPEGGQIEQTLLDSVDNIKSDRTDNDVLCELLLKYGLDLTEPIEEREIAGSTIYSVGAGALIVCLAKAIDLNVVEAHRRTQSGAEARSHACRFPRLRFQGRRGEGQRRADSQAGRSC